MKINKRLSVALIITVLLAITVAGISLWKNRPTSKGDPSRMTEEMEESEEPTHDENLVPMANQTSD